MRIIKEAIAKTLKNRPESKVDWSNSPFKDVKDAGKNAVGDFGENLYAFRVSGEVVKKGHDVLCSNPPKKTEVKTAFRGKSRSFFFNQIYEKCPDTGNYKDWDTLSFVFVYPHSVEIWEAPREKLDFNLDFKANNGWSWSRTSPEKLPSYFVKIHEEKV